MCKGENGEDLFIPMFMNRSTCTFLSRYPTDNELDSCRRFLLSDEHVWDPSSDVFRHSSMEEEQITISRVLSSRSIHMSKTGLELSADPFLHEFDKRMVSICPSLSQDLATELLMDRAKVNATHTSTRHHEVTAELIASKWGTSLQKARATLEATTQDYTRSATYPLSRRYRTDLLSQRLKRLNTRMYGDTLFAECKSAMGNNCAQLFTDGKMVYVDPMTSKKYAGEALRKLARDVGIPNTLVTDGAGEQDGDNTEFQIALKDLRIDYRRTEPYSPWQNRAEDLVKIVKSKWKRRAIKKRIPRKFWDFGLLIWEAEIYSRTVDQTGRTPLEQITGDTIDISECIEFEFYQLCWYWDQLEGERKIGRWLGVAHRIGSALCYWILLTAQGKILSRTTVQHVTKEEIQDSETSGKIKKYHVVLENTPIPCTPSLRRLALNQRLF